MKRLISICLAILMSLSLAIPALAATESGKLTSNTITAAYEYKITPGSKEWESFYEPEEKLSACYVPLELMKRMTTDALTETVLTYPLLVDIYAYDSIDTGIKAVSTYFGGINELLTRQDAKDVLTAYSLQETSRTVDTDITYFYCDTLLAYITAHDNVFDSRTVQYDTTTVRTPQGSYVDAYYDLPWSIHGITYEAICAIDQQYLTTYPSSSILSTPSPSYNCHSYAWYSQSTANRYWINDPSLYMSDGSYSACVAAIGCKVFYDSSNDSYNHSGIITALPAGGNPSTVTSKWGAHSLFSHYVNDCPYVNTGYNTSVGCWKRA